MQSEKLVEKLNNSIGFIRKIIGKDLKKREAVEPQLIPDKNLREVNLNIHTNCSFSPYSPLLVSVENK
jgi:ribosome-binding factor A